MSPALSLPTASWCPGVPSPLRAAPAARSPPGEQGPWLPPHQHLRLGRAIFSRWPQGCGSRNPDPAGELASPVSSETGCGAAGLGVLLCVEVAGDQPWSEPPPGCPPAAAPSCAAGAFGSPRVRSGGVAQPCLVHLASLGSGWCCAASPKSPGVQGVPMGARVPGTQLLAS